MSEQGIKVGDMVQTGVYVLDEWSGFMATCAMRYCLGRASYAPSAAMGWCREHWHRLNPKDHHNILRDVIGWLADRKLWDDGKGMTMQDYRAEWTRFALDLLARQGRPFASRVVASALHSPEQRAAPEAAPFLQYLESTT